MNHLGSEEIDSYSEDDSGAAPKHKKRRKILRVLSLIVIGLLGTTFAANISLSGGRVEFGQGVYVIKACDQWVAIGLLETAAQYDGVSRVDSMTVVGLDPRRCAGSRFHIQVFSNASSTALDLYTGKINCDTSTGPVNKVSFDATSVVPSSFASTSEYDTYAGNALRLINKLGENKDYNDTYHRISYKNDDGVYTISFTSPLASVPSVDEVTLESGPTPSAYTCPGISI